MKVWQTSAVVALFLSFAGCGSSEQNSTTPAAVSSALVHSAFVDRADSICSQGRERLILTGNRYFGNLSPDRQPSDAAVIAYAHRAAIPILRHQYGRLRQLRPPPGDEKTIGRILQLADQGIRQLQADPILLNRGSGIPPALEEARRRAFLYGLGSCGQPIERPAHAPAGR